MSYSFSNEPSREEMMREAFQDLVNLSLEEKFEQAGEYFGAIWPELQRLDEEYNGKILLYYILGTAAGSDAQLTENEAHMLEIVFSAVNEPWSVEDSVKMINNVANKDGYDTVKRLIRAMNPELTSDLIAFIAVVCAIDDRIGSPEQQFILDLMDVAAE